MWQIDEHRRVDKQLSDVVPMDNLKRYEKRRDIARNSGPQGCKLLRDFTRPYLESGKAIALQAWEFTDE